MKPRKKPLRVYLAGKMSSTSPIAFLENLRIGMRASTELLLAGYAVWSPFIDYSLFFQLRDGESISVEAIRENSMAWLEVADCVLVLPGWEFSVGTVAEINRALELHIPVFYSMEEMEHYYEQIP